MENTQEEIWKDILELDSIFEVSNLGNVKSKERIVKTNRGDKFKASKAKNITDNGKGYKQIQVQIGGKKNMIYVHRIVAKYFIENPDNKKQVNHKDGNKSNNHVSNLEWCTAKENMIHAVINGLAKTRGIENGGSKLTNEQVIQIREMRAKGVSVINITKQMNIVSEWSIKQIVKRKAWNHI